MSQQQVSEQPVVMGLGPLKGMPWPTPDPFLFCVHHDDRYPAGTEKMGPAPSLLTGRQIGQDFDGRDGWNMYHGSVVPGFPQHPHRGFETVTIVRKGLLDHSDSLGAAARFGGGDVQWLTAGGGVLHSEMFPLLQPDKPNPVELFQIWLNLPSVDKLVTPHFSMLWNHNIPRHVAKDEAGRTTEVTLIAGSLGDAKAPPPPPKSWASRADTDVAIWTLKLSPGARWTLPAAARGSNRFLYFFKGSSLKVGGRVIPASHVLQLRPEVDAELENGPDETELLMLQGRPIKEPVAQHGPFVMNTRQELQQAFNDYQRTQFGGWPWKSDDPVHPREEGRFARHADGRLERPT
ncbi:pirin family protein [Myxococcus stipitatus]|uniref:pirin family protein n=1 Tax=Myxococcus stipitatus TaxID=83455 RepID=UPI003144D8C0